jgi:hypothetical protein
MRSVFRVRCLGCDTHQTVALDVVRRPKTAPTTAYAVPAYFVAVHSHSLISL